MTTITIVLLLIAMILYGLKEYYQVKLKSGPHSTPMPVQTQIIETLMSFSHTGRMVDLGSGWGGMVLNLAKNMPEWQIDGVEQSPTPWIISNCRSTGKTYGNYRFFISPIQKFFLKNYDVIYVNLPRDTLAQILPRLVRALRDDTLILSYPHPLPRLPTNDMIQVDARHRVYMYRGIDAIAYAEAQRAQRLQAQQTNNAATPADTESLSSAPQQSVATEQTEQHEHNMSPPPGTVQTPEPTPASEQPMPVDDTADAQQRVSYGDATDAAASPRD